MLRKCKSTLSNRIVFLLLVSMAIASCASKPDSAEAVRAVIETQQAAWNRGDIDGFMDGYERSDATTFVSGDELTRGWQTVLDRYKRRYTSREEMGTLTFSDLDLQVLNASAVVADGRWKLTRSNDAPHGRFTLLFRQTASGWHIFHDTTTSATP